MTKLADKRESSVKIGYVLVAVGIGLIVIGLSWKHLVPAKAFWSEEDATAYAAIAEAAHAATITDGHDHNHPLSHSPNHAHSHANEASEQSDAEGTPREQFELARDSLVRAKSAHHRWGQYLSALGAMVAFAGMITLRRQA